MKFKVSYYAHHLGTGHLRHARRLAELEGIHVQVASTGPRKNNLLPAVPDYVALPPDAGPSVPAGRMREEDYLHYAPVGSAIQQRFSMLNQAWARFAPDVVMVDVSVEVALFARLSGYPVAFRRMPGNRQDHAHQLAYALSDALFGYFPASLEDSAHLEAFGTKSHYLAVPQPTMDPRCESRREGSGRNVVVQTSLASSIPVRSLAAAAASSPGWQWDVVGSVDGLEKGLPDNLKLHGILPDPGPTLRNADVVISSAGHNAVVAAAESGKPVLLIPEDRPHDEQLHFARALHHSAMVAYLESWDLPTDWERVLDEVLASDPHALSNSLFVPRTSFAVGVESMLSACIYRAHA